MQEITPTTIEGISRSIGDTSDGLTNTELDRLFHECCIPNINPDGTKWGRIYDNLNSHLKITQKVSHLWNFIERAMAPERHLRNSSRFETMRASLNKVLGFYGRYVGEDGRLKLSSKKVTTISEAEKRAEDLQHKLVNRNVHSEVLKYCTAELLADDYFHVTHESMKGIFERLRTISLSRLDGSRLIETTLSKGSHPCPAVLINNYQTESEISEQKGFVKLLQGLNGMFRNTTAHEPRVTWDMPQEDAEDLLSIVSLIHRRLDKAKRIRNP